MELDIVPSTTWIVGKLTYFMIKSAEQVSKVTDGRYKPAPMPFHITLFDSETQLTSNIIIAKYRVSGSKIFYTIRPHVSQLQRDSYFGCYLWHWRGNCSAMLCGGHTAGRRLERLNA